MYNLLLSSVVKKPEDLRNAFMLQRLLFQIMPTQATLDQLFAKLRIIHKAHWKAPLLSDVEKEITRKGIFVFRIGSNPWVAEIIISESVRYEVNPHLPERMLAAAIKLKNLFEIR